MSSVAQPAQTQPAGVRSARPRRSAARARTRPGLFAGGVLWIVLLGALLAGVVAVNVAVLRLNLELDRVGRERSQLRADVAGVRAQLSSAAATARIEEAAREQLGLVRADPESTVYVTLGRR
jgi:cell division protein FtsL